MIRSYCFIKLNSTRAPPVRFLWLFYVSIAILSKPNILEHITSTIFLIFFLNCIIIQYVGCIRPSRNCIQSLFIYLYRLIRSRRLEHERAQESVNFLLVLSLPFSLPFVLTRAINNCSLTLLLLKQFFVRLCYPFMCFVSGAFVDFFF